MAVTGYNFLKPAVIGIVLIIVNATAASATSYPNTKTAGFSKKLLGNVVQLTQVKEPTEAEIRREERRKAREARKKKREERRKRRNKPRFGSFS